MRKARKGQECRGFGAENYAEREQNKKTARASAPGPAGKIAGENYLWPALKESFSVPTT
jgi:hypothetical protein